MLYYMDNKIIRLADFDLAELEAWLMGGGAGEVPIDSYRSRQIFRWLGLGARTFDEMSNLPLELRASLASRSVTGIPEIIAKTRSALDATVKYAMKTADGCVIESVSMEYKHGGSVCVSSQAGCKMGCEFCATKPGNFSRDLSAGEMFGQVVSIIKQNKSPAAANNAKSESGGRRIGNIVVMGIGEPFDNYDNTLKFIRLLHDHEETKIGYRKITISTCGLPRGISRLTDEGLPIGLAVSLHAANDRVRSALMPVNRSFSIDKLIEACKIYTYKTSRRVTFEYALIKGVNDAPDDALDLLRKIRGMLCHINLIPINKTESSKFMPSPKENIARFETILKNGGVQVTVRRELGTDIMAACGQLRNSIIENIQS